MTGEEFNATTTSDELNVLIVEEYHRIGSQDGIMKVLADHGSKDVTSLNSSDYYSVLTAVRAL